MNLRILQVDFLIDLTARLNMHFVSQKKKKKNALFCINVFLYRTEYLETQNKVI